MTQSGTMEINHIQSYSLVNTGALSVNYMQSTAYYTAAINILIQCVKIFILYHGGMVIQFIFTLEVAIHCTSCSGCPVYLLQCGSSTYHL